MVWCPVHSKHLNGARAKDTHAYGDKRLPDGCEWMQAYLSHSWSTIHRIMIRLDNYQKSISKGRDGSYARRR